MSERLITNVRVSAERDDRYALTGLVGIYGKATWLKGDPIITAKVEPAEARRLAKYLLTVADSVDGDQ